MSLCIIDIIMHYYINYVNMQENCVNMEENHVYLEDNYVNMRDKHVDQKKVAIFFYRESEFYMGAMVY